MLTVFNRRELMTLSSTQRLFRVREALSAAGIPSAVKIRGAVRAADRARRGTGGLTGDALYTYTVYVHRDDCGRAAQAIQPAMRDNG